MILFEHLDIRTDAIAQERHSGLWSTQFHSLRLAYKKNQGHFLCGKIRETEKEQWGWIF